MKTFGIDEERVQATDEQGRLKRPIAVAVFGTLLSLGFVVVMFARSGADLSGSGVAGVLAFGVLALVASCLYAFIGARHSKAMANRMLGVVGGVAALVGVAFLVWILLAYAP